MGTAFLGIALGGCLRHLAEGARRAQRLEGRVPVGQGPRATAAYACVAIGMAAVGTAVGFHGLLDGNEPERAAGFLLAGLAAIPALYGLLTATAPTERDRGSLLP